ncbi:glucose-1-phosphate cytidylyltransferase [Acetobacter fabarum]|uniref:glucose-1-phosphate cytidylyltransferase n=1 Tax=Acetobacter fabarum TaxID=483199 RepID=UPI00312B364D
MKTVILAGGFGSRLSEETDSIPKPMVQIGGRPILWHIMKIYSAYGLNDFVVCLGYKGHLIKEFYANYFRHMSDMVVDLSNGTIEYQRGDVEPWRITLIDTGLNTQTGGRLKRVGRFLQDGPFCMTYGDGVGNVDIRKSIDFHKEHKKKATVTCVEPPGRFGLMEVEGTAVKRFSEKTDNTKNLVNGGFFVLDPSVLDYIDGDDVLWEKGPMEHLARDGQLEAFHHSGFWQPMDTLRDKRLLEDLWDRQVAPWKIW